MLVVMLTQITDANKHASHGLWELTEGSLLVLPQEVEAPPDI